MVLPATKTRVLTLPFQRATLPWTGPPEPVIIQGRHKGDVTWASGGHDLEIFLITRGMFH